MIYIEILLGLLLYISTMGYMQTFRGQSFFNFVMASTIMVFNYFAIKSVLLEMDISRLILIVSSISIVLFFIYKLFFGDDDSRRESEISPSIVLLAVFLVSAYIFLEFRDIRSFDNIMDIKDIPKQGKYEKTKDYNSKLNGVNFIVGTITINDFDRDKDLANLSLRWSSGAREKVSSDLEDKTLLINIPNNKAKNIFDNDFGTTIDFYAKVVFIEEKYTLLSTYIFYKKEKIILNRDKNAPQIAYTTKWNPLIYKGKRSYTKESDDSVKDNYTGLIWQKQTSSKEMNWDDAKAYCEAQTTDNQKWRLPMYNELYYLADRSKYNLAIDSYFNMPNDDYPWFWSNTEYANDKTQAWVVHFNYGYGSWDNKRRSSFVRCVR